jgi:hypothetical protein
MQNHSQSVVIVFLRTWSTWIPFCEFRRSLHGNTQATVVSCVPKVQTSHEFGKVSFQTQVISQIMTDREMRGRKCIFVLSFVFSLLCTVLVTAVN